MYTCAKMFSSETKFNHTESKYGLSCTSYQSFKNFGARVGQREMPRSSKWYVVAISARNTKVYKICELCKAILRAPIPLHNMLSRKNILPFHESRKIEKIPSRSRIKKVE